jgi:hypothetical protein
MFPARLIVSGTQEFIPATIDKAVAPRASCTMPGLSWRAGKWPLGIELPVGDFRWIHFDGHRVIFRRPEQAGQKQEKPEAGQGARFHRPSTPFVRFDDKSEFSNTNYLLKSDSS